MSIPARILRSSVRPQGRRATGEKPAEAAILEYAEFSMNLQRPHVRIPAGSCSCQFTVRPAIIAGPGTCIPPYPMEAIRSTEALAASATAGSILVTGSILSRLARTSAGVIFFMSGHDTEPTGSNSLSGNRVRSL